MAHNPMGTDSTDSENSQIFNATNQMRNVVDPRTGLFEICVPMAVVTGNNGSGPAVDLSLYYTPAVNNEAGLGDGYWQPFTIFDEPRKKLTLNTGEVLALEKNKDLTHPAVIANWSNNKLTVERKGGRKEVLSLLDDTGMYLPESLTTDGFNSVLFTWMATPHLIEGKTYYQIQLTQIRDVIRTLLDVVYTTVDPSATPVQQSVTFIFWPDDAAQTLTYTLAIKDYALQSVSLGDNSQSTFEYLDHSVCGWLLTKITNFDGLQEVVEYKDNGLTFPDNPKLSAMPCVSTHTLTPNGGGTPVITTYAYERQDPKKYRTIMSEGVPAIRTTIYQYNEKHDVTSETLTQGSAKTQTDYVMVAQETILSRNTNTTYSKANKSRKETNENTLDAHSALIRNKQSEVITQMSYLFNSEGNSRRLSTGEVSARAILNAICLAAGGTPSNPSAAHWGPGHISLFAPFASTFTDTEFVETPGLLSVIPELLPPLLPGLLNVALLKLHGYKMLPGLSQAYLENTLQTNLATDRFADAALVGQRITYFETDDFRNGRIKTISKATLDNRRFSPVVSEPLRSFNYTLGGAGNTELTTTTTDTDDKGNQRVTSETHNTLDGRLVRQIDADNNRTEYVYNPWGRLVTMTVCAQSATYRQVTTYSYPAPGQVLVTDPNGQTRLSQYDGQDQLVSEYLIDGDQRKLTKTVSYDRIGRELRTSRFDYYTDGTQITDWQESKYDDWNQDCGRKYVDGREDFDFYDPVALTRTQWTGKATDKHGTVTTYGLDRTVKKIEWKDQTGNVYQTQTATYTRARQVKQLRTTAELGITTVDYTYDGSGRLLSEKHSEKGTALLDPSVVYTYYYAYPKHWLIREAQQVDIEFAGKRQMLGKRTFDSWGRVTSLTRGTCTETYTYTGASKVPASTATAEGSVLQHEYIKELGSLLAKTSTTNAGEQKNFTYAYGAQGIATASEGEHLLQYNHDRYLNVTQQLVQTQPGQAKEVVSTHSIGGRVLDNTDPLGNKTLFSYSFGKRYSTNNYHFQISHTYQGQGLLQQEVVRGPFNTTDSAITFNTSYTYDAQQRESSRQFTLTGKVDLKLENAYYADDKLKSVALKQGNTTLGSRSLTYTPGGRLKACTTTGVWRPRNPKGKEIDKQEFTYDALGNIITCVTTFGTAKNIATHTYDSVNGFRLAKVENTHADYPTAFPLTYDLAGRVTQDQFGKKYTYDWLGRLIQAGSTRYTYDPTDRLMIREQAGEQSQIVYDGLNVTGEYSVGSNDTDRILNPGSAACTVQLIKRSGVQRTLFELRDNNGTVLISYDLQAQALKHHSYTAYGEHFSDEPDSLLGFNGEYRDTATGQYPLGNGHRWYKSSGMRFNTQDNLSPFDKGGPNFYGYCGGDPVNFQDPSGQFSVDRALRKTWGDELPAPLVLGKSAPLISAIIWGGVGILTAVMTGGASLAWSAALIGLAIVSLATSVTAVIIKDTNPGWSEALSWVSLGAGAFGGVKTFLVKAVSFAKYLARSSVSVARNLMSKAAPALTPALRSSGALKNVGRVSGKVAPSSFARTVEPFPFKPGSLLEPISGGVNLFDAGDVNTAAFITTGALGITEAIKNEYGELINSAVGDGTWLLFGSFSNLWVKYR